VALFTEMRVSLTITSFPAGWLAGFRALISVT
jgi:hypothetical protein